ncbi:MAG: RIP metalloprotease RseP [Firmicutes bacterium]|nr:RIP metalloprotease RseP [Bacillota bacterium]
MIKTIIIVIVMLEVLIIGHEFGHFITAKKCGVTVNEFAIGMGPLLLKRVKNDTQYSLRAFPIGGYCAMEGEDEDTGSSGSFASKSIPKRILIVSAGAIMNYLMAILILIVLLMIVGFASSTLSGVVEGSPADLAGLRAGDTILAVNGEQTKNWSDVVDEISAAKEGDNLTVTVDRGGETVDLENVTVMKNEDGGLYIGIYAGRERNLPRAVLNSFKESVELVKLMYQSLGMLITGTASVNDVVGPVGMVSVMDDGVHTGGLTYVLFMAALISVNLAVINLLPLPALDGGRLVFLLLCAITRKELNPEIEGRIHYIGFLLLMLLAVLITVKDIHQFIIK